VADVVAAALVQGAAAAAARQAQAETTGVVPAPLADDIDVATLRSRTARLAADFPLYEGLVH